MNIIKSFLAAAVPWWPIGWIIFEITREEELALLLTSALSVTIFFVSLRFFGDSRSGAEITSALIGSAKDLKDSIESSFNEKDADYYAQAEAELESGQIDKGLWSKALVNARGNEQLRKIEYMKLRASKLRREFNARSKAGN